MTFAPGQLVWVWLGRYSYLDTRVCAAVVDSIPSENGVMVKFPNSRRETQYRATEYVFLTREDAHRALVLRALRE